MSISINKLLTSNRIPSLPEVAQRVVEIAQDPCPDFDELIRVIKGDPAICSRLMRTVNSALFGLRHRVSSIESAVPILGANMVRTLVLSFTLAEFAGPKGKQRPHFQRLWRASLFQAVMAESLADASPSVDGSVWFLAGILQDIGRIALVAVMPEEYSELVAKNLRGPELLQAERRMLGFTHVDVSMQLAIRWRLENFLADGISKHHGAALAVETPREELETIPALPNALRIAALCNRFADSQQFGGDEDRELLNKSLADAFDIESNELDDLLTDANLRVAEVAAMFAIDIGEVKPAHKILAEAKDTLADIAVQSHFEVASVRKHIDEAKRELESALAESETLFVKSRMDALTGAFSRHAMDDVFESAIDYCRHKDVMFGVLFIDVDNFKSLNDGYGHKVGDLALKQFVAAITSQLRKSDLIIRYGGDEFVVVLPLAAETTLIRLAEVIRTHVAELKLLLDDNSEVDITCSVGCVCVDPQDGLYDSAARLIEEADQAMYLAKQRGGNQSVAFFLRGGVSTTIEDPDTLSTT